MQEPRALYKQVADDLREAIHRGDYGPGEQLPSQPVLAKQYGLVQTSISRAMAILESEGLIQIRRGKGAYVLAVPVTKRPRTIDRDYRSGTYGSSFAEEMRRLGLDPQTELAQVGEVVPPPRIAEHLGLRNGEQSVIRKRLMWASGSPVQIATSYIPVRYAGGVEIAHPDTGPTGIYKRLAERGYGPVRFTEDIEVRGATQDEAKFLGIPTGEPVYEILRSAIDEQDRPVEACSNVLAAKQWRLTYKWRQDH